MGDEGEALASLPGLAEVIARLERVRETGDSTPVLDAGAVAAAERLAEAVRERNDVDALHARHPLGYLYWVRALALGPDRGRQDRDSATQAFGICFVAGIDDLPDELLPILVQFGASAALQETFRLVGGYDADTAAKVIWLWDRVLLTAGDDDPRLPNYLANASYVLLLRYQHEGSPQDLADAMLTGRRSVRAAPSGHPERSLGLVNLAGALLARYAREGAGEDLDLGVDLLREAVEHTPADRPNRAAYAGDLGGALERRYHRDGDRADLDEAITVLREAALSTAAGPMGSGTVQVNLGAALVLRYELTRGEGDDEGGGEGDLDESLPILRAALEAAPAGHALHVLCLTTLGHALVHRYELNGDPADVDEAIGLQRAAVAATSDGTAYRRRGLAGLTSALYHRIQYGGTREQLDEAVIVAREWLRSITADDPGHSRGVLVLVELLYTRFERDRDLSGLAEARELGRSVSSRYASEADPARRVDYQVTMADVLSTEAVVSRSARDLGEAVALLRTALPHAPGPHDRLRILANLGHALHLRFTFTLSRADLDAAIDAKRTVVRELRPSHGQRSLILVNLGTSLFIRSSYTGSTEDGDAAIEAFEEAVGAAAPDHFVRHGALVMLTRALQRRFEETGHASDLDEAVAVGRRAVEAAPPGNALDRSVCLLVSGLALLARYRHAAPDASGHATSDASQRPAPGEADRDRDEALTLLRRALREVPLGQAGMDAIILTSLGDALIACHERGGEQAHLDEAVRVLAEAAQLPSALPMAQVGAAAEAGRLVRETDPVRASDFYEAAVTLLPRMTPRQQYRSDQQWVLGKFAGLASDAAALALSDTRLTPERRAARAVRLLEAGRGVVLGQALDLRGGEQDELAVLRRQHPDHAARFEELRDLLDRPEDAIDTLMGTATGGGRGDRHQLVAEFEAAVSGIRKLDGFGGFAQPPPVEELLAEAGEGAVVMLNVSAVRSDALVLTGAGVTAVPLPGLGADTVTRRTAVFQAAVHDATASPDGRRRRQAQDELRDILRWLWDAAAEPVLRALGHGAPPPEGTEWPRVWWVLCGPLSLLPIHAAGRHDEPGAAVLDRVVSSYTPTVRALRHARRPVPADGARGRPLIVAMPTTPGHAPLHHVPEEVAVVTARLQDHRQSAPAQGPPPTRDAVLKRLAGAPVAHFACHGETDAADPSQSRLFLHDHENAPFTVAALASVRLDHARLAYLSACRTATTDIGALFDEALHLTAAFQLAGFRHVVGTLWPIVDDTAVTLADTFYTTLGPDPGRAAYALHDAVRALRTRMPGTPSLWSAHVHAGA